MTGKLISNLDPKAKAVKIIDFKTSGYFSGSIMFLGILLLMASIPIFLKSWIAGVFLFINGVTILTTHNRLRIDLDGKVFLDYLWVFGMKFGEQVSFESPQYAFIRKAKVSQTMTTRVSTSTIRKDVDKGYLKFSEADKVFLFDEETKEKLVARLQNIAAKVGVDILDYSDEPRAI